jgi:hypothetical protein
MLTDWSLSSRFVLVVNKNLADNRAFSCTTFTLTLTVDDVADRKLTEIPLSQALTCRLFGSRRAFGVFRYPDNNESRLNLRLTTDHCYL